MGRVVALPRRFHFASAGVLAALIPSYAFACLLNADTPLEQYTSPARAIRYVAWITAFVGTVIAIRRRHRSRHAPRLVPALCILVTALHPSWTVPISVDAACLVHGANIAVAASALVLMAVGWQSWRDTIDFAFAPRNADANLDLGADPPRGRPSSPRW